MAQKSRELDEALSKLQPRGSGSRAGSRAGGAKRDAAARVHLVFDLTGRTGSYLYMSPEVTRCEPYNDRADVRANQGSDFTLVIT